LQLLAHKAVEQFGIVEEAAAFAIEQVADNRAPCRLISLRADEYRAAVIAGDLPWLSAAKIASRLSSCPRSFSTRSCLT